MKFAVLFLSILHVALFAAPPKQSAEQHKIIIQILKDAQYIQQLSMGMNLQIEKAIQENPSLPSTLISEMRAKLAPDRILNELANSWGSTYSVSELKSIQAFLKTPAGKKYLANQNQITERMAGVGGMVGFDMYTLLNKYDPTRYPIDEKTRAAAAKFEALRESLR